MGWWLGCQHRELFEEKDCFGETGSTWTTAPDLIRFHAERLSLQIPHAFLPVGVVRLWAKQKHVTQVQKGNIVFFVLKWLSPSFLLWQVFIKEMPTTYCLRNSYLDSSLYNTGNEQFRTTPLGGSVAHLQWVHIRINGPEPPRFDLP